MATSDTPISIPSNTVMKRLVAERAFQSGVSASEIVRQAIDRSTRAPTVEINDINKPFIAARLTAGQQQHLRRVAQQSGVSHSIALEAMLCDFLFGDEAPVSEAADEPDLFD